MIVFMITLLIGCGEKADDSAVDTSSTEQES